jgi:hypothetical protein
MKKNSSCGLEDLDYGLAEMSGCGVSVGVRVAKKLKSKAEKCPLIHCSVIKRGLSKLSRANSGQLGVSLFRVRVLPGEVPYRYCVIVHCHLNIRFTVTASAWR